MFFGMLFALPLYLILEAIRKHKAKTDTALAAVMAREPKVTPKMLFVLGVPAIFDLSSVLLMVAGLMHIDASMWMLLRGGGIVFVALMKQFALGDRLSKNMWAGVGIIALAVALVGASSMLNGHTKSVGGKAVGPTAADLTAGISLTIAGTFMQSLQYVYEEKVSVPPPLCFAPRPLYCPAPCIGLAPPLLCLTAGIGLTIAGTFMQSLQYVYEEKVRTAPPCIGPAAAPSPVLGLGSALRSRDRLCSRCNRSTRRK
jgi:drug/metabolite transporter (DMT)-like permease